MPQTHALRKRRTQSTHVFHAGLNGDESLRGVCWTLAFIPLFLFFLVSFFLWHPSLPSHPSPSCQLSHLFPPLLQSFLPFCGPLSFFLQKSFQFNRGWETVQPLLGAPKVAEWLSRQSLTQKAFFPQNCSLRLTPGHRQSTELEVASFQEPGLKLAMGASGLLGVRAGPVPPTTSSPRHCRHAHLLKGGGGGGR